MVKRAVVPFDGGALFWLALTVMARGGGADLIGVGEAAELLGVSTARLRQLRLGNRFIPEAQVISGRRLYRRQDVLRYKRKRVAAGLEKTPER